ncbi:MAG: polyhydroxyalkanoic acid system family protein [Pirellulales bacterium]
MPKFSVEVPHQLGQDEAIGRVQGLLQRVKDKYQSQVSDLEESWADNVLAFKFKTYGFKIGGKLTAAQDNVKIDGDLPIAAMMFKGRIEQTIRDELAKRLA